MAKRRIDRVSFREKYGALYARFQTPEKAEDGEIIWVPKERCTGTLDEAEARKFVDAFKRKAYSDLAKPIEKRPSSVIFDQAVVKYIEKKPGKNEAYLKKLLPELWDKPLSEFNQKAVNEVAAKLYPKATAATLNRQVYTPIIAVLDVMASEEYTPPRLERPRGYLPKSNFKKPPKDWWKRVVAACNADGLPHLGALVLFLRLHGRRPSEACRIEPRHIDRETWQVDVCDTKTDQEIRLTLAQPVIDQLSRYAWWEKRIGKRKKAKKDAEVEYRVFGYAHRWAVTKRLKRVCARHKIPYHVPKDAGRHSMATGLLEAGQTLKQVKEAGRWKTMKVPDMIYGHLEHNEVDDAARQIGEKWYEDMSQKGEVIAPEIWAGSGRRKQLGEK
jgi:integrase